MAETTDMYDNFTRCPTSAPKMNDPANTGVICVSSIARGGSLKVGNFQAPISSPVHSQFAMVQKEEKLEVVPGSTSMEAAPFVIPNPFFTLPPPAAPAAAPNAAPAPPAVVAKPKKKKKRHKKVRKHHKKGKKHHKKRHHKKKHKKHPVPVPPVTAPAPPATEPDRFIRATVEPIGDVEELNLGAVFGGEEPIYRVATRIHLEGSGLGSSCYIGTPAEPIKLEPRIVAPPSGGGLLQDPNGLPVEVLFLDGVTLEDAAYAVPGASGCGVVDPATQKGSLDEQINGLIGLPAASGDSKLVFSNNLLELVGTENDGTPPDGGEQLQEAFEAAK
jgi:hypothetical protein